MLSRDHGRKNRSARQRDGRCNSGPLCFRRRRRPADQGAEQGGPDDASSLASSVQDAGDKAAALTLNRVQSGEVRRRRGNATAKANDAEGYGDGDQALMSALKDEAMRFRPRSTVTGADGRAGEEARPVDVGDQALMRGLATAVPSVRPRRSLSKIGRRHLCRPHNLTAGVPLPWPRLRPCALVRRLEVA